MANNDKEKTTGCPKSKDKCAEKGYTPLSKEQYLKKFRGGGRRCGINRLKNAHKLAWKIRSFEIDKFWIRTAFFGGFTALIFNGYINILSSPHPILIKNFDVYLIFLGIIFSVAWLLSVWGSKHWQENWENHIDMLEDEITGPLHKIIYCKKWYQCYSVSRINMFLVGVVILIWIMMLMLRITIAKSFKEIDCDIKTGIVLTAIAVVFMFIRCRSSGGKWKIKKSKKEECKSGTLTYFIDRYEQKG
jgi:hypothetical protein